MVKHQLTDERSLLKIPIVRHGMASVLVEGNGAHQLPNNGEFTPMDEVWIRSAVIQIAFFRANNIGTMSFTKRNKLLFDLENAKKNEGDAQIGNGSAGGMFQRRPVYLS